MESTIAFPDTWAYVFDEVQGNVSGNVQYLVADSLVWFSLSLVFFCAPAETKVGSRLDDGRAVEETGKWPWVLLDQTSSDLDCPSKGGSQVPEDDGAEGEGQEASRSLDRGKLLTDMLGFRYHSLHENLNPGRAEAQFLERLPDAPAARQPVARCLWCKELHACSKELGDFWWMQPFVAGCLLKVRKQQQPAVCSCQIIFSQRQLVFCTSAGWCWGTSSSTQNWVDRWAPRNFEDLIGNASTVRPGRIADMIAHNLQWWGNHLSLGKMVWWWPCISVVVYIKLSIYLPPLFAGTWHFTWVFSAQMPHTRRFDPDVGKLQTESGEPQGSWRSGCEIGMMCLDYIQKGHETVAAVQIWSLILPFGGFQNQAMICRIELSKCKASGLYTMPSLCWVCTWQSVVESMMLVCFGRFFEVVFKGKQKKAPFKPGGGMPEVGDSAFTDWVEIPVSSG